MVERFNGKAPYVRNNHGSERRGVFPVPSADRVGYQIEQSRQDKAKLIELMKSRRMAVEDKSGQPGLGNQELPAFKHKQEIIDTIENYKAVILGGETGSGKSTQVPQYLYEAGYDKVFVLVPRRVIADGLGERLRDELTSQLKEEAENKVGIIHGERTETHDDNRILVMTPDTFNGMERDIRTKYSDKKVAIISDEIHEANLFTEIATGIAAMAVKENDQWRLIAASATHNASTLVKPLSELNQNGQTPVVTIEGRPFEMQFIEEPDKNPMEVYASLTEPPAKTMIFTSGKKEIDYIIEQTINELDKSHAGNSKNVIFRKLHGELTEVELSHINDPVPDGCRLVIVSSPAGMSGITIPGVTYVITDGTINRSELDDDGVRGLTRRYLSKAGITQQLGRAGRDVAGGVGVIAKPVTVEEDMLRARRQEIQTPHMPFLPYGERDSHEPAEIYHSNLSRVVLRVAGLDLRFSEINEFIPHQVSPSAIISAEESLCRLGALDDDHDITTIGAAMNRFPLSPEISRGLVEARMNRRSIQHLANAALIAAAVDEGGVQDYSDISSKWRSFLRGTTTDDFIAQLDLMTAVHESQKLYGTETELQYFHDHDLHPKRIERARKVARKILSAMRIDIDNLVLVSPRPDEEALLRSDFTAGMIDLVYQQSSHRMRKTFYKNIHSDGSATERFISARSIATPRHGDIVAGIPRWYEKRTKSGSMQRYDVIEQILNVSADDVSRYARQNGILTTKTLPPRIDGDMIVEQQQPMFGSIEVGTPVASVQQEYIPESSKKYIVKSALEKPGEAQKALRAIADELEHYRQTIPANELPNYLKSNAPEEITKEYIENLITEFAKRTRYLSVIDRDISHHIYSKGISINRYYDDEARVELRGRSPEYVSIGGRQIRVFYEQGSPYVTGLRREHKEMIKEPIFLEDGREILLQETFNGTKRRVSFGS